MTDRNEALRLADSIHEMNNAAYMAAIANLREQVTRANRETTRIVALLDAANDARDQLRAEVEQLKLAEEGAAQAFGDVVQQKRDLEGQVKRLQSLLDGAYASIRQHAARTTHKDEG